MNCPTKSDSHKKGVKGEMKQHNKERRLKRKQAAYDALIAKNPELARSMSRPGSIKKC